MLQILQLKKNMRAARDAQQFAKDLEEIGSGMRNNPLDLTVPLPPEICADSEEEVITNIGDKINFR